MTGDPFADRLVEGPTRQLYESFRADGYAPARALRLALGSGLSPFDVFADPRDAMAADLVLSEGVAVEEAGVRASRRIPAGPSRPETTSLLSEAEVRSAGRRYWREQLEAIRAERPATAEQRADRDRRFREAGQMWADSAPPPDLAERGRGRVRELRTVDDYRRAGLSEADARAAARRK